MPTRPLRRLPLGIAALLLAGCGHVPLTSLPALSRIDPAVTDPRRLAAAVAIPDGLAPIPGSARLRLTVVRAGAAVETEDIQLAPSTDPVDLAETARLARRGETVHAFRLSAADAALLAERRAALLDDRGQQGGGQLTVGVSADLCRKGEEMPEELRISTFLKTGETDGFVAMIRDYDLTALMKGAAAAPIPSCDAVSAVTATPLSTTPSTGPST